MTTISPPMISAASRARLDALKHDTTRHFLAIARDGMQAGACASTGEAAAFKLLARLQPLAAQLGDIDGSARQGFINLALALADPDAEAAARAVLPRVPL